jgi:transcriptional regulator with XRE-family HTH domain
MVIGQVDIGFGSRLRQVRERQGMSPLLLAAHAGLSPRTIERWEEGETEPKVDAAARVAAVLGVSLDYLAGIDGAAA